MSVASQQNSVAIIGYGTAAVNTLIALRNAGYSGKVRVFSNIGILPYSPILTSYYASGEKTYEQCFPWSKEELDALEPEVLSDSAVKELDPSAHTIRTAQGVFPYTKCVIASGATPNGWGFADSCDYQPLVLRTMDDAERLKVAITRPDCKKVLVSGASMIALKMLEACLERGLEVSLVGINPHLLDFNALPQAAIRFERNLQAKGVKLILGQTIKAVRLVGSSTRLSGHKLEVRFSDGSTDSFDEIAIAHGVHSNIDFLPPGSLAVKQALVVDEFMRTSDADVYAAGDVAQALELISGQPRVVGIWKNAAVQGAVAGRTIAAELAGRPITKDFAYAGSIATNTIAVQGSLFISAGTMEITPSRRIEVRESADMTVVYIFEKQDYGQERLVGFNVVADADEAGGLAYDVGAMLTLRIEEGLLLPPPS